MGQQACSSPGKIMAKSPELSLLSDGLQLYNPLLRGSRAELLMTQTSLSVWTQAGQCGQAGLCCSSINVCQVSREVVCTGRSHRTTHFLVSPPRSLSLLHVFTCLMGVAWEARGKHGGVSSLLLPVILGTELRFAWWQKPLLAKPSCQPPRPSPTF